MRKEAVLLTCNYENKYGTQQYVTMHADVPSALREAGTLSKEFLGEREELPENEFFEYSFERITFNTEDFADAKEECEERN